MAPVTYDRSSSIASEFSTVLSDYGYIDTAKSEFLGRIVSVLKNGFYDQFSAIYSLQEQVDISRASGTWLERWGVLLNEPRNGASYAYDLSLSNLRIAFDPSITAGEITTTGGDFPIPKGTRITSSTGSYAVRTIDNVSILADNNEVYVRVISETPGEVTIPAGILDQVEYDLLANSLILPSKASDYELYASHDASISGGEAYLTDDVYKYVLINKAQSIGLFNNARSETLLKITDIVNVYPVPYRGGVNIYIDTRLPELDEFVMPVAQAILDGIGIQGLSFNIFTPVYRTPKIRIKIDTGETDTASVMSKFAVELASLLNETVMGSEVDFSTEVDRVVGLLPEVTSAAITLLRYNGREITGTSVTQHFNEKIVITEGDITVVLV